MTVSDTVLGLNFLNRSNEGEGHILSIRVHEVVPTDFVFSIICRPYAVTLDEIGRHGSFPIVAPVKPYTEFALIYKMVNRAQEKGSDQSGSIRYTYL
jgi:hypothetical protein